MYIYICIYICTYILTRALDWVPRIILFFPFFPQWPSPRLGYNVIPCNSWELLVWKRVCCRTQIARTTETRKRGVQVGTAGRPVLCMCTADSALGHLHSWHNVVTSTHYTRPATNFFSWYSTKVHFQELQGISSYSQSLPRRPVLEGSNYYCLLDLLPVSKVQWVLLVENSVLVPLSAVTHSHSSYYP